MDRRFFYFHKYELIFWGVVAWIFFFRGLVYCHPPWAKIEASALSICTPNSNEFSECSNNALDTKIEKGTCKLFQFQHVEDSKRVSVEIQTKEMDLKGSSCPFQTAGISNCFSLANQMLKNPDQPASMNRGWWWRGIVNENILQTGNFCSPSLPSTNYNTHIIDSFRKERWGWNCAYSSPSGTYYFYLCALQDQDWQGKIIPREGGTGSIEKNGDDCTVNYAEMMLRILPAGFFFVVCLEILFSDEELMWYARKYSFLALLFVTCYPLAMLLVQDN